MEQEKSMRMNKKWNSNLDFFYLIQSAVYGESLTLNNPVK